MACSRLVQSITTNRATTDQDIWVCKYDTDGAVLWTDIVDGPDNGMDNAYAVAADDDGNIIVVGRISVSGQAQDVWIQKYDGEGNVLWTHTYNGVVNEPGNIVVIGEENVAGEQENIWIRKFDPAGNWTD